MPNPYQKMVAAINRKIRSSGRRKLIWFGTRGTDSRALLAIDYFKELYCIVAPLDALSLETEMCLETQKQARVDLDSYTIVEDSSAEAGEMHRRMLDSLSEPSFLVSYRPSAFLTSIYFPQSRYVDYLGVFHELQDPFENKPWVETELRKQGINTIPYIYLGDNDRPLLEEMLEKGPQVLRVNRSDGGVGLSLIGSKEDVDAAWKPRRDHFLGVAPYLDPNIPLNVNAVVFPDGRVKLHSPSLQLIGINGCTRRKFGYCGNDFARIADLPAKLLDEFEDYTRKAGKWLASKGFRGAFGIDALVCNEKLYITEVNPRFQGSSDVSSMIDLDLGRPDMFLDHIAAFLGIEPDGEDVPLRVLAQDQMKVAQIVCHNITTESLLRNDKYAPETERMSLMLVPKESTLILPEAILFRTLCQGSVTLDGVSLLEPYPSLIQQLEKDLFTCQPV